jgi:hypothetical protein
MGVSNMISNPKLYVRLEAYHRVSDEYRNQMTALRVIRNLIIHGKYEA